MQTTHLCIHLDLNLGLTSYSIWFSYEIKERRTFIGGFQVLGGCKIKNGVEGELHGTWHLMPQYIPWQLRLFNKHIMGRERRGGSNFIRYIIYVASKYKTVFTYTCRQPNHFSVIHTITLTLFSSIFFQCKQRHGGTNEETCWLCIFCPK